MWITFLYSEFQYPAEIFNTAKCLEKKKNKKKKEQEQENKKKKLSYSFVTFPLSFLSLLSTKIVFYFFSLGKNHPELTWLITTIYIYTDLIDLSNKIKYYYNIIIIK